MEGVGGGGRGEEQQKVVVVVERREEGGVKGSALIRDREGVSRQTERATWKPAVHTPAAS